MKVIGLIGCWLMGCRMDLIASGYDTKTGKYHWRCERCGWEEYTEVGNALWN